MLHSLCQQIWTIQQWPQDWKRSIFISISKKGNDKECSNYCTIAVISQASKVKVKIFQARLQQYVNQELTDVQAGFRKQRNQTSNYHTAALISLASKVMLKILQARFQQYVNWELTDVQAGFRDGRGIRESNFQHLLDHRKNKRIPGKKKHIYFCFIDYTKAFDSVDHNRLWKILLKMGIPDHLTCLLQNLYIGQEAIARTGHGTMDWFKIGKRVRQGCTLSPCLFNLYAEYIMQNARLDEAQAGIKIAWRNINNLRYADDTTLWQKAKRNWRASWWKWKRRVKKLA